MAQTQQLKEVVGYAKRIFVTSHVSPDPDAISSVLLCGRTIQANYSDKAVKMALEEPPGRDLSFLAGYNDIFFGPIVDQAKAFEPDLFIIVDAPNYERVSRTGGETLRQLANKTGAKLVIIDHHTQIGLDTNDLYINDGLTSNAEQLHKTLFLDLKMNKPDGYAETTMLGIISDTARFLYDNPNHRQTFDIVSDLLDEGVSIERLENRLDRYTKTEMKVLANLAANMTSDARGFNFTYVDDDVAEPLVKSATSFKLACEVFTSQFIRNFESNKWGFIVYPEIVSGQKTYSVSFRSVNGVKNVANIAKRLGGGGHESAAGAKSIEAESVKSAVEKVMAAIVATD